MGLKNIALGIFLISVVSGGLGAYSIYNDWLGGKPVGLADFKLYVTYGGRAYSGLAYAYVIDEMYGDINSGGKLVWSGLVKVFNGYASIPAVKVERVPVGLNYSHHAGYRTSFALDRMVIALHSHEEGLVGARFVIFEPRKPLTTVPVKVELHKVRPVERRGNASPRPSIIDYNSGWFRLNTWHKYFWLKAGEVHSIVGLRVRWVTRVYPVRTWIYFDTYTRSVETDWDNNVVSDSGWYKSGKGPARADVGEYVEVSGDVRRVVKAWVRYRIEEWAEPGFVYSTYWYFMIPEYIMDLELGPVLTGYDECNSYAPYYAAPHRPDEGSQSNIMFDNDWQDDTPWLDTSVSFSIGVSWGHLSFSGSITLYRAAGASQNQGTPPYLTVIVDQWVSGTLYWWYDSDDRTSYVAHFSWGP